jgi:hypothetical protein
LQVAELFLDIRLGLSVTGRGAEKNGDFAERTPLNRAIGMEAVHAALGKLRRE